MAKRPAAKTGAKSKARSKAGSKAGSKTGGAKHAAIARRGLMLVLSSPSGAGKTTLSRMLLEADSKVELSVSVTTRRKRPGEVDGRDYHFIDRPAFDAMVARGELLEWAEVFGNCYGTPRKPVDEALRSGRDVLFDIDWQGTQQLREKADRDLVSIFVLPPSIPDLEKRLRTRAQDSDEVIHARMTKASDEMSHWAEYDYVVINTDIDRAFWEVRAILSAERLKRERQTGLTDFVRALQAKL
jgi:guanylate kinase